METIIGACGLICSECNAFKATQAYDSAAIACIAEKWSKQYKHEFRPEDVWCEGCMTAGQRKNHHCVTSCGIRACVKSRKLSDCAQCPDYSCDMLKKFFDHFGGEESPAKVMLDALRRARPLSEKI
ncbi:MAG: DUF3795 domain-containing protein [Phycisphaerales bacterium]|nr:DUF3795 domain-containing protein [Phycisphaerales bacterium]